jgi:hypothetical protein
MMIKITGGPSNPTSATAASQEASPEIKDARTPEKQRKDHNRQNEFKTAWKKGRQVTGGMSKP